jgi:cell division protein FtsB
MVIRRLTSRSWGRPSAARDLLAVGVVVVLAVAVLAGLAVLPTKTWFSQRDKMAEAEAELARIEAEIVQLEDQQRRLETDAEIEIVARRDYGLVRPGEESYRIVSP